MLMAGRRVPAEREDRPGITMGRNLRPARGRVVTLADGLAVVREDDAAC
jgi:hypothetical protein